MSKRKAETLEISEENAKGFVYEDRGDTEDGYPFQWRTVNDEITDQTRWQTWHYKVIQDTDSGRFWGIAYGHGSTEIQEDHDAYDEFLTRLYAHEVKAVEYRTYPPEDE